MQIENAPPTKHYLAYAAVAPPSPEVQRAVMGVLDAYARLGSDAFPLLAAQREVLRRDLATMLGASAESVAFVSSTTRGITDLALCLKWRKGERIVCFSGEFPANVTPWQRAAELFELDVTFASLERAAQATDDFLAEFEQVLAQGVRLVAVSAVQFRTGLRMPLDRMSALCKRYGCELAVDAIQACGVVPLDVRALGIDYLACGAHKWLRGIEGVGFLYAAPERLASLAPRTAGWLSHEDPIRFLLEGPGELRYDRPFREGIQFVEGGSSNAAGLAALQTSVRDLLEIGVDGVYARVSAYLTELDAGLSARGLTSTRARDPSLHSGILSIAPPAGLKAGAVARELRRRGVVVSTPDGLIRFAPHHLNAAREIPDVLAALDETLASLRG
ncbi:MAG TPA: aminotransferase class V-fold PLP-dependent enzyme [Polyangiaceae bacterium]